MSSPYFPEPPGDRPNSEGGQPQPPTPPQAPYQPQPGYEPQPGYQPQPGYPAQSGWQGQQGPQATGTNGMAIAGLVSAIVWLCGIGSLAGIAFGAVALGQIKKSGQQGRGLAIAAIALGILGTLLTIAFIVFVFILGNEITGNLGDFIEEQEEYQRCVDSGRTDCVEPIPGS